MWKESGGLEFKGSGLSHLDCKRVPNSRRMSCSHDGSDGKYREHCRSGLASCQAVQVDAIRIRRGFLRAKGHLAQQVSPMYVIVPRCRSPLWLMRPKVQPPRRIYYRTAVRSFYLSLYEPIARPKPSTVAIQVPETARSDVGKAVMRAAARPSRRLSFILGFMWQPVALVTLLAGLVMHKLQCLYRVSWPPCFVGRHSYT